MSKVLESGLKRAQARLRELEDEHERLFSAGTTGFLRNQNDRARKELAAHIARICTTLDAEDPAVQESEARLQAAKAASAAHAHVVVRLTPADKQRAPTSAPASVYSGKRVRIPANRLDEVTKLRERWWAAGCPKSGPAFADLDRLMRSFK